MRVLPALGFLLGDPRGRHLEPPRLRQLLARRLRQGDGGLGVERRDLDEHERDVVARPGGERLRHERLPQLRQRQVGAERGLEPAVAEFSCQPVGAQQQPVADGERHAGRKIRHEPLARAEHAQILREHVLVRVVLRAGGGRPGIELLLILGVVARDALQRAAALQIDAAVTDVAAVGVVAGQVHGRGGRAADLAAGRDHIAHGNVCPAEEIERIKRLVAAARVQRLRAQKGRLLAVGLAAHAVEHAVDQPLALLLGGCLGHGDGGVALERAVAVVVILVVVPAGADVRLRVTQRPHRASLPCG